MTHELTVWLFAERIGTLSLVQGRLSFRYSTEWLVQPQARALSVSLPVQTEPFNDQQTRPFFAGLLPEGQLRRLIARRIQVSAQNDYALLDQLGGDCAGAVSLLPPEQAALQPQSEPDVQWLSSDEAVALLDLLPDRPMLAGQDGLRLSLAGAQDKLPVVVDGERIGLPRHGTPSSHILKPAIRSLEDTVINEGFCMALAEAMHLPTAQAQIRRFGGHLSLLVERYDRTIDAQGRRQRLHQEDFCQALGVNPEMKYQNEGGPSLTQCFDLVRRVTRPSAPQVLRLLDAVLFNALIGNHDAHAKNFSLLYDRPTPRLAPLYDLLSTAVYPSLTSRMAMKIGSTYRFSEVQNRHWERFAQEAGLNLAQTRQHILAFARALPATARQLQADPGRDFAGHAIVENIVKLIDRRCALTTKRLNAPAATRSPRAA